MVYAAAKLLFQYVGSDQVKICAQIWSENPRVGSSILSLGTMISGTYETIAGAFFCLNGHKNGHNPEPSLF